MPEDKPEKQSGINYEGYTLISIDEIERIIDLEDLCFTLHEQCRKMIELLKFKLQNDNGEYPEFTTLFLRQFEEYAYRILEKRQYKTVRKSIKLIEELIDRALDSTQRMSIEKLKQFEPLLILFVTELERFKTTAYILSEFGDFKLSQIAAIVEIRSRQLVGYFVPNLKKVFTNFYKSTEKDAVRLSAMVDKQIKNNQGLTPKLRDLLSIIFELSTENTSENEEVVEYVSDLMSFVKGEINDPRLKLTDEDKKQLKQYCRDLRLLHERYLFLSDEES